MQYGFPGKLPGSHAGVYSSGGKSVFTGVVSSSPYMSKGRLRFDLLCSIAASYDEKKDVQGRVRVTVAGNVPGESIPEKGDLVSVKGRVRSVRNFGNPGGFDYVYFLARRKVHATIYSHIRDYRLVQKGDPGFETLVKRLTGKIRGEVCRHIDESPMDKISREILKALAAGRRDGIDDGVKEAFAKTGAGHLLAISGLHVGIVSAIFYYLFENVLRCFNRVLFSGNLGRYASLLTLFPVILYGQLTGMSPSTIRAVIMVSVFFLARFTGRDGDLWNVLALSAMVVLLHMPESLYSVSFQFSYAAVSGIIFFYKCFPDKKNVSKPGEVFFKAEKALAVFLGLLKVSLAAQVATLPLAAFYFNRISLVGVPLNMVFVPLIGFIAVPLAIVSMLLIPLGYGVSSLLFSMAGFVIYWVVALMKIAASFDWSCANIFTPKLHEIVIYYISFLSLGTLRIFSFNGRASLGTFFLMGALPLSMAACAAGHAAVERYWPGRLVVTILDVGQGGSALIQFPGGHVMLVDGGGFFSNRYFDVGKNIVSRALRIKKIGHVNTVVLTHPESDHMNGLRYVLENFSVDEVWTTGMGSGSRSYGEFVRTMRKCRHNWPDFKGLPDHFRFDGTCVEIIYPRGDDINKLGSGKRISNNDGSMVIRVEWGDVSFLFPGDIMADAESFLAREKGALLRSTVLVVPHHGSGSSSTDAFLEEVRPHMAAVSAGWNNRFRFPDPLVMKRYDRLGVCVMRTDLHGAIEFKTDGACVWVRTFY